LTGESCRVHQIAKNHRELATFRVTRRYSRERCDLRGGLVLGSRLWCWLSPLRSDCLGIADPDQNSVILISGKPFRLNEVNLQILDVVLIQVKSALQGAIGDALLPLKQLDDFGDKLLIVHGRYSTALTPLFRPAKMTHFRHERKGCSGGIP